MKRSSSVWAAAAVYVSVAVTVFLVGFLWGLRTARDDQGNAPPGKDGRFRVGGDSMMPTLRSGQICRLRVTDDLRRGDVVALRWQGKQRVKRIAGLGGDVVDRVRGRLLINGRRPEQLFAERDPKTFLPPARVRVPTARSDWQPIVGAPDWVLYTHHNPHEGGRATAVMDDYPSNIDVSRRLNPVDRLAVTVTSQTDASPPDKAPVVFFRLGAADSGSVVVGRLRNGRARLSDAVPVSEANASVPEPVVAALDAAHPIAIAIGADNLVRLRPQVWRDVEYRDDRPSGQVHYPITLGQDQVFVIGDNVPISVDSRQIGPLSRTQILGVVQPEKVAEPPSHPPL